MRGKTHAAHKMVDDVPEDVKARRLQEMIDVWREDVNRRNRVNELRVSSPSSATTSSTHVIICGVKVSSLNVML